MLVVVYCLLRLCRCPRAGHRGDKSPLPPSLTKTQADKSGECLESIVSYVANPMLFVTLPPSNIGQKKPSLLVSAHLALRE